MLALAEMGLSRVVGYAAKKVERAFIGRGELPKPKYGGLSLAQELFIANRNNTFPQNFSFKEPVSYRLNGFRFITHPVEKNPDGTHTYVIERKKTGKPISDIIELVIDPDYPRDRTFHTVSSFRGCVVKDGILEWVHIKGEEAQSYAEKFLSTMRPPREEVQEPY